MTEYIEREAAIEAVSAEVLERNLDSVQTDDAQRYHRAAERVLASIPAADVRPAVRGKWEKVGEQMLINLENAREQYAELGYPHRKILNLRCSSCRKVTMVDSSIAYDFCPHCGADMRGDNK